MNKATITRGSKFLCAADSQFADALALYGKPEPRQRPAGFETFFNTIVSQQISTAAARSIMARVREALPDIEPVTIIDCDTSVLRNAGMSFRKIEYAQGLAAAILDDRFDVDGLESMSDDEAMAAITSLRGFGRWSAEIYLMFSLGRRDIFPADDLALRVALGTLKRMKERPTPAVARNMVEHWGPWRSVGSLFLWHYHDVSRHHAIKT